MTSAVLFEVWIIKEVSIWDLFLHFSDTFKNTDSLVMIVEGSFFEEEYDFVSKFDSEF